MDHQAIAQLLGAYGEFVGAIAASGGNGGFLHFWKPDEKEDFHQVKLENWWRAAGMLCVAIGRIPRPPRAVSGLGRGQGKLSVIRGTCSAWMLKDFFTSWGARTI